MKQDGLTAIPGVGKSIAQDLRDMGIVEVADLKGRDPGKMYEDFCALRGQHIDRCMLYVMRCAVDYAERGGANPQRPNWWDWSDERMGLV